MSELPSTKRRIRPFPLDALERVARAQVDAGRALLAHLPLVAGPSFGALATALGGPVRVRLVEAYAFPVEQLVERAGAAVGLRLGAPGGRSALLLLDDALAPRLARRALGVESEELPAPRPLTVAEQGALAFLVAALLDGEPLRVEGYVPLAPSKMGPAIASPGAPLAALFPDPLVLALEARVETPVGDGWARLFAPERLRVRLPRVRRAPTAADARALHRLADARATLCMEVGSTPLERRVLAGLGPRDVVLFERFGPRPPFGGPLTLRLGRGGFPAHLGGDGLTITGPFRPGGPFMPTTPPSDDDALAPDAAARDESTDALLRELPVEVVCELGRVTLTGRELLELRPGAVLPVGRPLAGPVDLTVGGRIVARGELVDVEGEIGVRIVQMLGE